MKKIKEWLISRFLPLWAKETVLADNRKLKQKVDRLEEEIARLRAYIDGMSAGVRSIRRITINAGTSREDKRE